MSSRELPAVRRRAVDCVIGFLLAAVVAGASLQRSSALHPLIYHYEVLKTWTSDTWFDADIPRAVCMATDQTVSQHQATSRHPLISAAIFLPAAAFQAAMPAPVNTTIRRVSAFYGALWIVAVYCFLRLIGCDPIDGILFALLAAVSAAGLFWTAVPEVHVLAATTLLLPLGLVSHPAVRGRFSDAVLTAASTLSLSLTLTNWMSGLTLSFLTTGWRRACQVSFNAFVIVSLLWGIEAWGFPRAQYFFRGEGVAEVISGMDHHTPGEAVIQVLEVFPAFFLHSVVMPAMTFDRNPLEQAQLSVQESWPGTSGWMGVVATLAWLAALGLGAWQLARDRSRRTVAIAIATVLAGQLVLHLVVGQETFLYAAQFAPLLIGVAAAGTFGPYRGAVRAIAVVLVLAAGGNNTRQFAVASQLVDDMGRELVAHGATFESAGSCR